MPGFLGLDHIAGAETSIGPATSFGASVAQGFEQAFRVDSAYSLDQELANEWKPSLDAYERETGERLERPINFGAYEHFAESVKGRAPGVLAGTREGRAQLEWFKQLNDRIKALKNPRVQPFEDVLSRVAERQRQIEQQTGYVGQTGSGLGMFIGGMAGSMTMRDPQNLISLGFGGVGRTTAMRIATEMGLFGGLQGATEAGMINPNRELAGLPQHNVTQDILMTMAGAGLLRGAGEFLHPRISAMLDNLDRRAPEAPAVETPQLLLEDLRPKLEAVADSSPRARSALELLDRADSYEADNPHGMSAEGQLRFNGELADILPAVQGRTDTGIARVLGLRPLEASQREADMAIVRSEKPDVAAAVDETQTHLNDVETRIQDIEQGFQDTRLSDAVALVDEDAGKRIGELESVINDPATTEPRRAAAQMEAEAIVNRVGQENIAQKLHESEIPQRKQLQFLRRSRRAAKRENNRAQRIMDEEIKAVRQRAEAKAVAAEAETQKTIVMQPDQAMTMNAARHDVAEAAAEYTDKAAEAQPVAEEALARIEPDENGMIDLGDGKLVPANFEIMVGENGEPMKLIDVLNDLRDDDALQEAMRSCAL